MKNIEHILLFHAAAIGDAVLATPVSVKLKFALPGVKISYLTHSTLFPLLRLCTSIDEFHAYDKKEPIFKIRQRISDLKADVIVDLSGSLRSFFTTSLLAGRVLHYRKQGEKSNNVIHAVDNYLQTIAPLSLPDPPSLFPSLEPDLELLEPLPETLADPGRAYVAIVPGVGSLRPHRAWPAESWAELCISILNGSQLDIVLIGGPEEKALCESISTRIGRRILNVAGSISLPETAAVLKKCRATVSGDTGPAHISVAVGTPVVGIYGPTMPKRSGPYGPASSIIDVCGSCACKREKFCVLEGPGEPGRCMKGVPPNLVLERLVAVIKNRSA